MARAEAGSTPGISSGLASRSAQGRFTHPACSFDCVEPY
ncbi:hypothetical protein M878_00935 [Streptomyces roseochromogenus subsp. oscitans DS 12.976]|uniref:Uncharacterized protein n=1 Tax=Streptomyces roseochromogenus subsp. oscitans DS 12.976 TaxID=1352936 RepID=V6KX55_STRRC|nr:hypothetical protein M878_00935 [Streptomyces roseochromogenus subsp. oscitans DS 12.976]